MYPFTVERFGSFRELELGFIGCAGKVFIQIFYRIYDLIACLAALLPTQK